MQSCTYCVLSDLGLATQTAGHVSMCNQSRVFWQDSQGRLLNLSECSLEEAWDSPTRKEIAQALKSGVKHKNCQDCWDEEAAGRQSQRLIHNSNFSDVEPCESQPRVVILKPGNACNLACRHCAPHTSSGWYKDYFHVEHTQGLSFKQFVQTFGSSRRSYKDDAPVWKQLEQWCEKVVYWDLYGAEPLIIDPLLSLLRTSTSKGHSADQSIHINTNGTVWHDDFNHTFAKFAQVHIGISADAIGDQFEYMRHPARWPQFLDNLNRYQILSANNASVYVDVCITASLLNVWYLPEYMDFFQARGLNVGINLLHHPPHLNMRIAGDKAKQAIIKKFQGRDRLDSICKFLSLPIQNPSADLEQFFTITEQYDQLRQQCYADTFHDFWQLLKSDSI